MIRRSSSDPPLTIGDHRRDKESLLPTEKTSPPKQSSRATSTSVGDSNFSRVNPLLFSKLIFRKVLTSLTSSDDDTSSNGIVPLLKDILIGIASAITIMSIIIFFDHINLIHLQSAHNSRETAFSLLNDPETLTTLEESAGLKFIPALEYEQMMKEIEDSKSMVDKVKETSRETSTDLLKKLNELLPLMNKFEKILKESGIRLDKFCEECTWKGKKSCGIWLLYVIERYGTGEVEAKVHAMEKYPQCVKND
ncbi:hypothetical protein HJC23_008213 [Cyclotella cryptica]|uniref:Uncharacterized protein n=1 Tax=Cyclotella cryptica TaxID=29204 RepID=A0ABD3NJF4_9STRA